VSAGRQVGKVSKYKPGLYALNFDCPDHRLIVSKTAGVIIKVMYIGQRQYANTIMEEVLLILERLERIVFAYLPPASSSGRILSERARHRRGEWKDQRQPDVSREDGGPDGSNGSTVLQDINRRAESGARDVQTRFLLGGYSAFHG